MTWTSIGIGITGIGVGVLVFLGLFYRARLTGRLASFHREMSATLSLFFKGAGVIVAVAILGYFCFEYRSEISAAAFLALSFIGVHWKVFLGILGVGALFCVITMKTWREFFIELGSFLLDLLKAGWIWITLFVVPLTAWEYPDQTIAFGRYVFVTHGVLFLTLTLTALVLGIFIYSRRARQLVTQGSQEARDFVLRINIAYVGVALCAIAMAGLGFSFRTEIASFTIAHWGITLAVISAVALSCALAFWEAGRNVLVDARNPWVIVPIAVAVSLLVLTYLLWGFWVQFVLLAFFLCVVIPALIGLAIAFWASVKNPEGFRKRMFPQTQQPIGAPAPAEQSRLVWFWIVALNNDWFLHAPFRPMFPQSQERPFVAQPTVVPTPQPPPPTCPDWFWAIALNNDWFFFAPLFALLLTFAIATSHPGGKPILPQVWHELREAGPTVQFQVYDAQGHPTKGIRETDLWTFVIGDTPKSIAPPSERDNATWFWWKSFWLFVPIVLIGLVVGFWDEFWKGVGKITDRFKLPRLASRPSTGAGTPATPPPAAPAPATAQSASSPQRFFIWAIVADFVVAFFAEYFANREARRRLI